MAVLYRDSSLLKRASLALKTYIQRVEFLKNFRGFVAKRMEIFQRNERYFTGQ